MDSSPNNDFIAFNTSPKNDNGPNFYPTHYSSPMHGNRNRNKQKMNYQYGGNSNKHNNKNYRNRNSNGNHNRSGNKICEDDINQYFHPSMLEDPWERLLKNSNGCNVSFNNSINAQYIDTKNESVTDFIDGSTDSVGRIS
ncbi:uncharacterized protein DDB_G0280315-like [Ctenocephalides felis]|nr:uncharacterized protein DDB_G0280315-like [Ctenocephalides felis]